MLLPLSTANVPSFIRACAYEHIFGSKILTALQAYGLDDKRARFTICMDGEVPTAALYLAHGVLTISASADVCTEDMIRAAEAEEVREVNTNRTLCDAIERALGGTTDSSYFMVYRGAMEEASYPDIRSGDPRAVFDVLQRSHEYYRRHYTYDTWGDDITQKLSRGLIEIYQLEVDGEVVGTGSLGSSDDECCVIGAIAVVPEARGKGYGTRISRFLTMRTLARGKTPRLMSGYDAVAELYRTIGYEPCGRWGELIF